jgi:membrane glycosyltransferase
MSPVVLGLALAIPLVALTSRRDTILAPLGVLRIPEEIRPPAVLERAASLSQELALAGRNSPPMPDRLLLDRELLTAHRDMLPPPRRRWVEPLEVPLLTGRARLEEAPTLAAAWAAMTGEERVACLADGPALEVIAARSREGGFASAGQGDAGEDAWRNTSASGGGSRGPDAAGRRLLDPP